MDNGLEILYENEMYVVLIKPVGVLSESTGSKSVASLLGVDELYTVHRLDKDVSGVMVYAKTKAAAAFLSAQMQSGEFLKEYLAVVEGKVELQGRLVDLLFHDRNKNKTYVVKRKRGGVKEAALNYETVGVKKTESGEFSLLKIKLETGRTHQIRVQFASRGFSLFGDRKYGSKCSGNIALFSHKISFVCPDSNKRVTFEALPQNKTPWNLFFKANLQLGFI